MNTGEQLMPVLAAKSASRWLPARSRRAFSTTSAFRTVCAPLSFRLSELGAVIRNASGKTRAWSRKAKRIVNAPSGGSELRYSNSRRLAEFAERKTSPVSVVGSHS